MPEINFTCAHCRQEVARDYRGSGPRPSLCSNACKVAAWKLRHPDRVADGLRIQREASANRAANRQCACGQPLALKQRRWCSIACGRRQVVRLNACRSCGVEVPKHAQRCETCRLQSAEAIRKRARRSPGVRAAKARRKAMQRGSIEGADRFDPIAVLERDRWRCHLCGIRTPRRLRGTCHDQAPELDHITPLAVGGLHTMINTACACRQCNLAKGAQPLGQLRLLA